jgi:lysophospholipase L1-like esterase
MKGNQGSLILCFFLSVVSLPVALEAQTAATQPEPATVPVIRNDWLRRHEGFTDLAKKGDIDLLFLGDSITDGWRNERGAAPVWRKYFESLKPANFGIGGDRTQHLLWRLQNGELDGIQPRVAVVMIGTNNLAQNASEEIAEGIKLIVQEIRSRSSKTRVLLLAIFPREEKPGVLREKLHQVNAIITKLEDGKNVRYLDIGGKFLQPDNTISQDIMPDFLHLSLRGYEIWAEAIIDVLKEMMAEAAPQ